MAFLDWFNDPDVAEERREIQRHLRCTDAEAVTIQKLDLLADRIEALEMAEYAIEEMDPDEGDEDEPPLGV